MAREGWDLIVVGAGSAGATVAARSAARGRRVLLLEAGPDFRSSGLPEILRPPGDRAFLHLDQWADLLWGDLVATRTSVQQPQIYLRGRGVGGSSSINGQIAIRPPREDYDDWAAAGCEGWAWEEVLPYFRRLETDANFGSRPYHGDSGPIPVWRMPREQWGSADEAFAQAALDLGFGWADDVNAPGATGLSPYPINTRNLRRVTTNDGYLEPARELKNLTVRGDTLVDRVLFDGRRATGVEIVQDGERVHEHGDEIVLCAGSIHSPAILMRSGIGPSGVLSPLGIEVVADLPVGQSLQDHPMICLSFPLREGKRVRSPDDRTMNTCVRYSSDDPGGSFNDMMLLAVNWADPTGATWPYIAVAGDQSDVTRAGMFGVWVNQTHSRGTLSITSRDPTVQPLVEEGMLADERDRRRLREGVRKLSDLLEHDAVTGIIDGSPYAANTALWEVLDDDRKLDEYLMNAAVDTMHATSTCRMGPLSAPTSVVDPSLRVLGLQNLSVADASIFPSVPRANTNLASIAVGEAFADRLR
jgi:choline dehydrogenase-like flavoprotein